MLLTASDRIVADLSARDFLWRVPPESSSMHVTVGPRLEELGPVPEVHSDFVRLAALVYLVDRTAPRGRGVRHGTKWTRQLRLRVPVADAAPWSEHAELLEALLDFLTGDEWELLFERRRLPRVRPTADVVGDGPVLLFSGGADSLAGALLAHADAGIWPVLVSHWSWTSMGGIQVQVADALTDIDADQELIHHQIRLGRRWEQIGSGAQFGEEDSSRARSLLFVALGLAVAAVREAELVIAENGYTSLNVPLGGERRGPLSTRTTHPAFLDGLQQVLTAVGLHADMRRPYEGLTKGQLFVRVRDAVGAEEASALLSMSHSCSKPGAQYLGAGFSPADQCGLCYSCLVRRAAFVAADVDDRTEYVIDKLAGDHRRAGWLTDDKRSHWTSVQSAASRGLRAADILALGLPSRFDRREALSIAQAGLGELAALNLDLT